MRKKVFISHRTADYEVFVFSVVSKLKEYGFKPWISEDDENIAGGRDWASSIEEAITNCDYFLVIITDAVLNKQGQIMNELRLASDLEKVKIAVTLTDKPIPSGMRYHLGLEAIPAYKLTEQEIFEKLFYTLGVIYQKPVINKSNAERSRQELSLMETHTDPIFSDVVNLGGYSWGKNKSVIQNISGGWLLSNIRIEDWNTEKYDFEFTEYADSYQEFLSSPECRMIMAKGKNHTRWMLTGYDAAYDSLFLSIQKTEWIQTQYVWHHLLKDEEKRKNTINMFFDEEESVYPTSLCLHLILIDNQNRIVASRIKKRKKDDYPNTIAVTIGEQLNETDYSSSDNFVLQWMRRSLSEEFGLDAVSTAQYVDEESARIMSLNLEGDIYNFSLVCCVRLKCTTEQLFSYYKMHRSSLDEFDELYPISVDEVPEILKNSDHLRDQYHPSSFLRLLFACIYVNGELPF